MAELNLQDAFVKELRDALSAEKQITKSLPRMARKADHAGLRRAFEEHLAQTERQIERLEKVFDLLGLKPRAVKCEGMSGIIEEGKEILTAEAAPAVRDAMLIAAAQKVEHYEIATYGTMCTWAVMMGRPDVEKLLRQTLDEEKRTDEKLTKLAETGINMGAVAT